MYTLIVVDYEDQTVNLHKIDDIKMNSIITECFDAKDDFLNDVIVQQKIKDIVSSLGYNADTVSFSWVEGDYIPVLHNKIIE